MKMSIYEFYKEKYDLKKLNLKITDAKILFLIYDEEQYYYFKNDNFLSKSDNLDILDEINFLNSSYKLKIINFYPLCFCDKTLIIALKTLPTNSILQKYKSESISNKYLKIINFHKNGNFSRCFTSDVKKEIDMSQKYIRRYEFHKKILKKYILTEKKRRKKEFHQILYNMLPDKKSIIDVSCGDDSDIFLLAMKKHYEIIVGNDICLNYLNLFKKNGVIYTNDNIEVNCLKKNSYDVSFCKNTLHHMNNALSMENALKFLDEISDNIIIVEIMDPQKNKGLPSFLNKYLYTKFLKDAGHRYIDEKQFVDIINNHFKNHNIDYQTFVNILGTYKIAKITRKREKK